MDINKIKLNCKYANYIEDGNIICKDGGKCECQWQLIEGAYYDCDVEEGFILNRK